MLLRLRLVYKDSRTHVPRVARVGPSASLSLMGAPSHRSVLNSMVKKAGAISFVRNGVKWTASPSLTASQRVFFSSSSSSSSPKHLLRPQQYLKEFYLRVHPDLISGHEGEKQNQESLALLNSFVDYIEKLQPGKQVKDPPPSDNKFIFFCRSTQVKPVVGKLRPLPPGAAAPQQALNTSHDPEQQEAKPEVQVQRIEVEFSLPQAWKNQSIRILAYYEHFLRKLVLAAGVEVPLEVQDNWKKLDESFFQSQRPPAEMRHSPKRERVELPGDVDYSHFDIGDNAFHHLYREEIAALRPPRKKLDTEPRYNVVNFMQRSDLIWFSPVLSLTQQMQAMFRFSDACMNFYNDLRCNEWLGTPVYFDEGSDFHDRMEGAFVIPWEFHIPELVHYLNQQLPPLPPDGLTHEGLKRNTRLYTDERPLNRIINDRTGNGSQEVFQSTINNMEHLEEMRVDHEFLHTRGDMPSAEDFRAERKRRKKARKEARYAKRAGQLNKNTAYVSPEQENVQSNVNWFGFGGTF